MLPNWYWLRLQSRAVDGCWWIGIYWNSLFYSGPHLASWWLHATCAFADLLDFGVGLCLHREPVRMPLLQMVDWLLGITTSPVMLDILDMLSVGRLWHELRMLKVVKKALKAFRQGQQIPIIHYNSIILGNFERVFERCCQGRDASPARLFRDFWSWQEPSSCQTARPGLGGWSLRPCSNCTWFSCPSSVDHSWNWVETYKVTPG